MLITTQDKFEDYRIKKTYGMVQGSTIRARHIGTDILAGLRNIVGGEVHEYTKMLGESREQALDRMRAEAENLGANGIVCCMLSCVCCMRCVCTCTFCVGCGACMFF